MDLTLLWLWCRPAAPAPIPPLGWEPPYASGVALEKEKKKKKKKERKKRKNRRIFLYIAGVAICIGTESRRVIAGGWTEGKRGVIIV